MRDLTLHLLIIKVFLINVVYSVENNESDHLLVIGKSRALAEVSEVPLEENKGNDLLVTGKSRTSAEVSLLPMDTNNNLIEEDINVPFYSHDFQSNIEEIISSFNYIKPSENNIKISLCHDPENLVMLRMALKNFHEKEKGSSEKVPTWDIIFYFKNDSISSPIKIQENFFEKGKNWFFKNWFRPTGSIEYREANLEIDKKENFQSLSKIVSWYINGFYAELILKKLKYDFENSLNKISIFRIVEDIGNLDPNKYTNDKNYFIMLLQNFGRVYFPNYHGRAIVDLKDLSEAVKDSCFDPTVENTKL